MAMKNNNYWKTFHNEIKEKESRKLKAQENKKQSVWFGFGMFGLVGWSVMIPLLLCLALGIWIDTTWPSRMSWTLMLLFVGVGLGCLNAWYWIVRERKKIEEERAHE